METYLKGTDAKLVKRPTNKVEETHKKDPKRGAEKDRSNGRSKEGDKSQKGKNQSGLNNKKRSKSKSENNKKKETWK